MKKLILFKEKKMSEKCTCYKSGRCPIKKEQDEVYLLYGLRGVYTDSEYKKFRDEVIKIKLP